MPLLISFPKAFVWIGWKNQIEINLKKKIKSKTHGRAKNNVSKVLLHSIFLKCSASALSMCIFNYYQGTVNYVTHFEWSNVHKGNERDAAMISICSLTLNSNCQWIDPPYLFSIQMIATPTYGYDKTFSRLFRLKDLEASLTLPNVSTIFWLCLQNLFTTSQRLHC